MSSRTILSSMRSTRMFRARVLSRLHSSRTRPSAFGAACSSVTNVRVLLCTVGAGLAGVSWLQASCRAEQQLIHAINDAPGPSTNENEEEVKEGKEMSGDELHQLVSEWQALFVAELEALRVPTNPDFREEFQPVSWLRNGGENGGGTRYQTSDSDLFNRASVNVSHVVYPTHPRIRSATALSTILHPANPHAPSMHFHVSYVAYPDPSKNFFRLIADLNPSIIHPEMVRDFAQCMDDTLPPKLLAEAREFGDAYFYIPSLSMHRGAHHVFVNRLQSGDTRADAQLADQLARATIATYARIVQQALEQHPQPSQADLDAQLRYHTRYCLQVLTLDRGTTTGLLTHRDNDVGTLGSIPARIDRELLTEWRSAQTPPQDLLLGNIVSTLPPTGERLSDECRAQLAQVVRTHYRTYPEAKKLQAQMGDQPPV